MIYIVSETTDVSTEKVLEWLDYYGVSHKRINVDTDYYELTIEINNHRGILIENNSFFWIRRGYFPFIENSLKQSIYYPYLKNEYFSVIGLVENFSSKIIGSYFKEHLNNKIENLVYAQKAGLLIPNTIVTNKKEDLLKFVDKEKKYITKSISKSPYIYTKETIIIGGGTNVLNIEKIPQSFSMSLVQEYIEKKFEIRTFFIEDNFYSMAIFSQNDDKTKIDYRNYNDEIPNRCVPFILPKKVLDKIKKFVKISNHNTGSIDMIYSENEEYYFLEINPMGQFDWLSGNCNYQIEKKIAKILKNKDERK